MPPPVPASVRALVVVLLLAACTARPGPGPAPSGPADPSAADPAPDGTTTGDDGTTAAGPPTGPPAGTVRVQGCEPRSLLPASVDRFCGLEVADALYTTLVQEPADGGPAAWGEDAEHAVARSLSTQDAVTWRIELEPGWVFHDGQPLRAEHFVDAWNFAAHGPNAQPAAHLFAPIVGYRDVSCPDVACEPAEDELAGLRVVDELTIEVELERPDRLLPNRLANVAFAPLPPQALEDPDAFGEAPVGNGPLRLEGTWRHDEGLSLRAHEAYAGEPAGAEAVEVVLVEDPQGAWDALEDGRVDVVTEVPPGLRERARARYASTRVDGDRLDLLVVPVHRPGLRDPALVEALSRAVDRRAVADAHLQGLATPAPGLVPAVVGGDDDRCGTWCDHDPAAARELLERADVPERGIELWIDGDAGHPDWARAVLRQWREHLGLGPDRLRLRTLPHASFVAHLQDRRVAGLHPLGWTMDVASPLPYLEELHLPGGLFNFDGYDEPGASAALARAATAPDQQAVRDAWRDAEARILADGRAVPLWVRQHEAYHRGDVVADVRLGPRGDLRLSRLRAVVP